MKKKEIPVLAATCPLDSAFTHLLFNLCAQGYSHIKFTYSGRGDIGCIDEVIAYKMGSVIVNEYNMVEEVEKPETSLLEETLKDELEKVVNDKILEYASDWWNNEGGGGTLWLDLRDGSYIGDHYINIIQTEESKLTGYLGNSANQKED